MHICFDTADIEQSMINISAFDTNYLEVSKNVLADSEYLFGDDLTKHISTINTNNKLIQGKYYNRSFSTLNGSLKALGNTTARGSNQANIQETLQDMEPTKIKQELQNSKEKVTIVSFNSVNFK